MSWSRGGKRSSFGSNRNIKMGIQRRAYTGSRGTKNSEGCGQITPTVLTRDEGKTFINKGTRHKN